MTRILSFILIMLLLGTPAFADKLDKKRAKIQTTRAEVLEQLYQKQPSTRGEIENAVGYAVFSNIGVNVFFISAGGGSGVVHDNKSGKDTYMKMGSAGVGIGLGVKDFSGIFIFHTRKALDRFINSGWDFAGQADAAAKSGDKGGESNLAGTVVKGVSLYQLTKNGLALQATLQGTKYWIDKKLN